MKRERDIAVISQSAGVCVTPALACAFLLLAIPRAAGSRTERVNLFPKLQAGQSLTYRLRYRLDKNIRTQSTVVSPLGPSRAQIDVRGLLHVDVGEVQSAGRGAVIHARTRFDALNSDTALKIPEVEIPAGEAQRTDPKGKLVEFTISADGRVDDVKGLDKFSPEEQQAWGDWVSLFAMAAAFPERGVKRGERWESGEAEKSPAPIARLVWLKRSTYVRDEPCRTAHLTINGQASEAGQPPEKCAVIVTTAALKQQSSKKDATPEDFKLHELQTMGTARGTNQVIAYISLKTGLVVRATEEASQSMDVVVAKKDGTNRVHYSVDAKSNSEVLLVADAPLIRH
ncbi:MAG: hypothetical protein ACHQLQ_11520 [Candidatus Acidiferrales bacterium]